MGGFDPRIVEHVLQGFDKSRPNSNMFDLGVTVMEETYGRERRHRWFTLRGYKALLNQENIDEVEHVLPTDLTNTGGFTDMPPELFYNTLDQLHQHQDTDSREEKTKKRRKPPKNPILPDGTVKKGRPRKNQPCTMKRKRDDLVEDDRADDQPRPSKRTRTVATGGVVIVHPDNGTPVAEPAPRKRGRPPKRKPEDEPPATPVPKKRGRPPKNRTPATAVGQEPPPLTTPLGPEQGDSLGTARDQAEPPILLYPEVAEQSVQRGPPLRHAGDSQPSPPLELQPLIPVPRRELTERSQSDPNGVRNQWPVPHIQGLLKVPLGLGKCAC